jgi:acyl carrier protein
VTLDALPLTVNGKLDRRALPEPSGERPELGGEFVAPRTEMEKTIAEVWSELLGVTQVGVHDNFFELGGESLRAIQVASRIRDITGIDMPLRWIFRYPTVEGIASQLDSSD